VAKGILSQIKREVETAGKSRKSMWFVKAGQRRKVRFLTDFEDALVIPWHQMYKDNKWVVNIPCLEQYGKACPFCDNDELKHVQFYAWSVYDYEAKERQVFLFKVTSSSPIPHLVEVYESKGTLLDRDLMIKRTGEKADTLYTVMPEDKSRDRTGIKPFKSSEMLKLIWEANGTGKLKDYEEAEDEEEEEEDEDADEEELDDEDDELEEEDDDSEEEEEEEPPRKRKVATKPVAKKNTKRR
jgi:hypothetical protein